MTNHEIIQGDCIEELANLDCRPHLILTSPPYDNLRTFGGHDFNFDKVADAIVGVMPEGGVLVWVVGDATVDGSETGTSFRQSLGFMERGLKLHDTMIYHKKAGISVKNSPRYKSSFEYMFIFGTPATFNPICDTPTEYPGMAGNSKRKGHGGVDIRRQQEVPEFRTRDNVWTYDPGFNKCHPGYPQAHDHPATFPYALAVDHITTWTNPGDLVLDPMAGSGTVSRAAKDLERNSIAIEIHEPYVDLIRRRMAQEVMALA